MILASRALPRVTRAGGSPLASYPVPVPVQAVGVWGEDLEALVGDVGFSEARETLEKMLQERYAPRTQTLTHSILSAKYWLTVSFSVNSWSLYADIGCYMSGNYWRIVTL
jgi:hypothetical protein